MALLDISHGGCMVECHAWSARPGDHLTVKLPGFDTRSAHVVWLEDDKAGIAFEELLHDVAFNQLRELIAA